MENKENAHSHIKGWGIDIDPDNEPTYPMKKYTGDDHKRIHYDKPPQQYYDTEILHSVERPGLPAVFGTSVPPSGLSGMIRRYAFKFSEGRFAHWLPLLLADRVNVVEGILDDFIHGKIPNLLGEHGFKADWKYNRKNAVIKLLIITAAFSTSATYILLKGAHKKKRKLRFM